MEKTGRPFDERLISGPTFFYKFVFPTLFVGFGLAWSIGVGFVSTGKGRLPSLPLAGFGLLIVAGGLNYFVRYHFPLKQVWVGEVGLRVSNFRTQIEVPFAAIESITQMTEINLRYVIIDLTAATIFGQSFTFVPRNPRKPWPFDSGEDAVVIDLRARVANDHKRAAGKPVGRVERSIMADDEIDGLI